MPEVSVIIVNRDGRDSLARCLTSVREAARGRDWEVVVADNASTDRSPELCAEKFPEVRLLRTGANLGFARANNLALAESRAPFVLFLNPDTALFPGAVDTLLEGLRQDPKAAACGPLLVQEGNSYQVSFGRKVSFFGELVQKSVLNPYFKRRLKRSPRAREVGWLSAACLLARREAVEAIGGFDEGFFLYFEDIDLCARMADRGWRMIFLPEARVFHEGGAATKLFAPSRFEYRKSQVRFYRKHGSRTSRRLLGLYLRSHFFFLGLRDRLKKGGGEEARRFRELLKKPEAKP